MPGHADCEAGGEVMYQCALKNGAYHCANCLWDCRRCRIPKVKFNIIFERYEGTGHPPVAVWRGTGRGQG